MGRTGRVLCGFIFMTLLTVGSLAWADQGRELFDKQCAGCHSIGGGDGGGPDLKGIVGKRPVAWLERIIVEPDKLTAEKDPTHLELVKKYGYEMPKLGLSSDDAKKILTFLSEGASSGTTAAPVPAEQSASPKEILVTPELLATGKALLTGEKRFSKGGAPCIACHAFTYPGVHGGNLATDLAPLYEGMGEQGMKGALKSLKFPIMKKAYADKPLTDDEIAALIAISKDASGKTATKSLAVFPLTGAALFVFLIAGLALYKRRIR